jgi:hypothetical protein
MRKWRCNHLIIMKSLCYNSYPLAFTGEACKQRIYLLFNAVNVVRQLRVRSLSLLQYRPENKPCAGRMLTGELQHNSPSAAADKYVIRPVQTDIPTLKLEYVCPLEDIPVCLHTPQQQCLG